MVQSYVEYGVLKANCLTVKMMIMISIIWRFQEREGCYKEEIQDIVCCSSVLLVCSVRESELSLLPVRYVWNAHSLSLMHEKHPQATILYAHLEMRCAYGI